MALNNFQTKKHPHPPITDDTVGGIETKLMIDEFDIPYHSTFIGFGKRGTYGFNGNHAVNICWSYPDCGFPFWEHELLGLTFEQLMNKLWKKFDGKYDYWLTLVDNKDEQDLQWLEWKCESEYDVSILEYFAN